MSSEEQLHELATAVAEEILRSIYGDDFQGCTVHLDTIASVIFDALVGRAAADRELLGLYEKATEAIKLLATPPPDGSTLGPPELQALLGDRLDTIRTLTEKIISTTAVPKSEDEGEEVEEV